MSTGTPFVRTAAPVLKGTRGAGEPDMPATLVMSGVIASLPAGGNALVTAPVAAPAEAMTGVAIAATTEGAGATVVVSGVTAPLLLGASALATARVAGPAEAMAGVAIAATTDGAWATVVEPDVDCTLFTAAGG